EHTALIGVAATGLILAAGGRFAVPALLFWLCSSAALAALWTRSARRTMLWFGLALSDAAVCAATIGHVLRTDGWSWGEVGSGWPFWALGAGAIVRAALVALAGSSPGAALPLLAGGSVVVVAWTGRSEPWLALAILLASVGAAGGGVARSRHRLSCAAVWPVGVALAVCLVAPAHVGLAGAAAAVSVAVVALWPWAHGRGAFERGAALSLAPLTAGGVLVVAGAAEAFGRAIDMPTVAGAAPWTAVAALLPLGLAAGVVLGGRIARERGGGFLPEAVLGTWILLAASVALGIFPGVVGGGRAGLGTSGGATALNLLAVACGVGASVGVRARPELGVVFDVPRATEGFPAMPPKIMSRRELSWTAAAVAAVTAGAAIWLTVAGLKVGFL
nr:hypothetical protein [Actinomycetota bacterium]